MYNFDDPFISPALTTVFPTFDPAAHWPSWYFIGVQKPGPRKAALPNCSPCWPDNTFSANMQRRHFRPTNTERTDKRLHGTAIPQHTMFLHHIFHCFCYILLGL